MCGQCARQRFAQADPAAGHPRQIAAMKPPMQCRRIEGSEKKPRLARGFNDMLKPPGELRVGLIFRRDRYMQPIKAGR
jgi:hypothetical protein